MNGNNKIGGKSSDSHINKKSDSIKKISELILDSKFNKTGFMMNDRINKDHIIDKEAI